MSIDEPPATCRPGNCQPAHILDPASVRVVVPDPVPDARQLHRLRTLLNRSRQRRFLQRRVIIVERFVRQPYARGGGAVEEDLQVFASMSRGVTVEIMKVTTTGMTPSTVGNSPRAMRSRTSDSWRSIFARRRGLALKPRSCRRWRSNRSATHAVRVADRQRRCACHNSRRADAAGSAQRR